MNIKFYLKVITIGMFSLPYSILFAHAGVHWNRSIAWSDYIGKSFRIVLSDPYHYSRVGLMFGRLKGVLGWVEPNIQMIGLDYPIVSLGTGYRYMHSKDQIWGIYAYYEINNLFQMVRDNKPMNSQSYAGSELIGKTYHISANLHLGDGDDHLPLHHIGRLEHYSPTTAGFNIKGSLKISNHFSSSIGYYRRAVDRRAFRIRLYSFPSIIEDRLVLDKKHGIVGGVQYTYNPVHSVAINFIYDNLTKFSINASYQFKLDDLSRTHADSFHASLCKPTDYQIGPTLQKHVAPDRSAYRQRVKDLLAGNPVGIQLVLANEFDQRHSIGLRQEAAKLWLELDKEKREKIVIMETQNRKLLPFELRLMVIEEAFSEDRISRYTFMDERVQVGYPDWQPQLKSQHLRIFMEHYNNLQTNSLKINFINLKDPRQSLEAGINYFF
jgi:hypothetical protein